MKNRFVLSRDKKTDYCMQLTDLLPEIRNRLGMTQEELGNVSGVSRVTISQIESGRANMNWLHFTALMMICFSDRNAKELLYAKGLLDTDLLRFFQVSMAEPQVNVLASNDSIDLLRQIRGV